MVLFKDTFSKEKCLSTPTVTPDSNYTQVSPECDEHLELGPKA